VHWLGLKLYVAMVGKLLILEPFSQWKLNKIKTENCIRIWGRSWCYWKAPDKSDFKKFIPQFLELSCGRYWYFSGFCCWKFKQIAKIGFGRKNQLSPLNVFTLLNLKNFNSENVKIKNAFTPGLMAQATLVQVKGTKHDHRLAKLYVGFYGN